MSSCEQKCTYPDCKCPFDMGEDEKCLLGLDTVKTFGEFRPLKQNKNKKNKKPKQYRHGIDTFTRAKENMSVEGIMAATVMTVDAYIWRDKGSDYEDFCKARDWLNFCIEAMENDHDEARTVK